MNKNIYQIWDEKQEAFVAKNESGWYVMITTNPHLQKQKYNGNIYGRVQKNLDLLYLRTSTKLICDADSAIWEFVEIAIDY